MNPFTINSQNTKSIVKTYRMLQIINVVVCSVLALASLILTAIVAAEDEIMWLIPLGVLLVVVLAFFVIFNLLRVKFGMYYDIRMLRLNEENKNGNSDIE